MLSTLLQITEKSGNLRKELKQDIVESVSTIRNIFINLKNRGEEQNKEINRLEVELNNAREELTNSRVANLLGCAVPSRNGTGQTPEVSLQRQPPPSGGARKLL